jgi:hypothetical protein
LLEKSSVAELPLNLTWNIYTFSGCFRRKERAFSMTEHFKEEINAQPTKHGSTVTAFFQQARFGESE